MSPVYLYALLAEAPKGPLPAGLGGEPLRLVSCDGILAAVGEVAAAPDVSGAALTAHDAAVRRLAAASSALLPARFGSLAEDDGQLCAALQDRMPALREALQAVRGCDQMTLRFLRPESMTMEASDPGDEAAEGGPGTRYLAARRAVAGDPAALPEIRVVLDALAPHVRGERRERHERPPLVASVYHLVPRDALATYRAALEAATREGPLRVTSSGPWPPYAFAPDALA
jgi:gas vesicle protein GvpL/GvpF